MKRIRPLEFASLWRCLAYAWASPNSLLGLTLGLTWLCFGAKGQIVQGALEIQGGHLARQLNRAPPWARFQGITLGHVIIALSPEALKAVRMHEHVHIRQYERWGPFFLPAYVLSSAWQLVCRRRPYWDNAFERQAYREESTSRATHSGAHDGAT